jgi:hypothetical protein
MSITTTSGESSRARSIAVARFPDHAQPLFGVNQNTEPLAQHLMVVDQEYGCFAVHGVPLPG